MRECPFHLNSFFLGSLTQCLLWDCQPLATGTDQGKGHRWHFPRAAEFKEWQISSKFIFYLIFFVVQRKFVNNGVANFLIPLQAKILVWPLVASPNYLSVYLQRILSHLSHSKILSCSLYLSISSVTSSYLPVRSIGVFLLFQHVLYYLQILPCKL